MWLTRLPPPAPPPGQVTTLPPDMAGKKAVRGWMSKLHGMPASYELNEDEVRQLLFDLVSGCALAGQGAAAGRPVGC